MLSADFMKVVGDTIEVMAPLIQLINDLLHPSSDNEEEPDDNTSEQDDSEEDGGGGIEAA